MAITKVESLQDDYLECLAIVNDPDRRDRMEEMKEENKFYFNAQWTSEESDDLGDTGQVDITLNAMRRAFRTLISLIVGPQPTAKFMPRDAIPGTQQEQSIQDQLTPVLNALQGLWNHCWYISNGVVRMRRGVQSQIIMGLGWIGVE
ncbi:MAG: hypothetical protein KAS32_16475, partial [Candidatus Peribacteraceae bacterium]|nr:hypothetical protein [Candidatus Peribacteraceae bacterium]